MTQFTRMTASDLSSSMSSPVRSASRDSHHDSHSDYSNPTSLSSFEAQSSAQSPVKQIAAAIEEEVNSQGKKKGFWGNSPFRRRSKYGKDPEPQPAAAAPSGRNTWAASRSPQKRGTILPGKGAPSPSPEPVDPRANFQLNIGQNVFDVASPDTQTSPSKARAAAEPEEDPIAAALAELKGVASMGKQSNNRLDRTSVDRYHGISTPAPPRTSTSTPQPGSSAALSTGTGAGPLGAIPTPLTTAKRGTPPPSYEQPVSLLGAPKPAFTSKQMQQTTQKYVDQKRDMFNSPSKAATWGQSGTPTRPTTRGGAQSRAASPAPPRATSPAPLRAPSPQPKVLEQKQTPVAQPAAQPTSAYASPLRPRTNSASPTKPYEAGAYNRSSTGYASSRDNSPSMPRAPSRAAGVPAAQSPAAGAQSTFRRSQQGQPATAAAPSVRAPSPAPIAQPQPQAQAKPAYTRPVHQPAPLRPEQARQQHQPAPLRTDSRQQQRQAAPPRTESRQQQHHQRATSPQPQFRGAQSRPGSSRGGPEMAAAMALQLAPTPDETPGGGPQQQWGGGAGMRGRAGTLSQRPRSSYYAEPPEAMGGAAAGERTRSKSVVAIRQGEFSAEGKTILHYGMLYPLFIYPPLFLAIMLTTFSFTARAMYMYQAAIPEELSFSKGDILAISRMQDDGWWEAEIVSRPGRIGLVPSNYLQNC